MYEYKKKLAKKNNTNESYFTRQENAKNKLPKIQNVHSMYVLHTLVVYM